MAGPTYTKSIINYVVFIKQTPLFYKSIEAEASHTGKYIANEIEKIILEIGINKVDALVTDKANNMKSAWYIIKDKYPNINTIGCAAHTLNLLFGDVTKIESIANLVVTARNIVTKLKKFTNHIQL